MGFALNGSHLCTTPCEISQVMRRCFTSYCLSGLIALAGPLFAATAAEAAAGEPVNVLLASGRHFAGVVDSRTNDAHLWLRTNESSISLLRPIDWDRVVSAQIGDKKLSAGELRAAVADLKTTQADREPRETSEAISGPTRLSAASQNRAAAPNPVRTIQIDADLGHWAAGVEATGIVVTVRPLDADGRLVAVDGTLEVDLIGQRFTVVTEVNGFPPLGRWTVAVRTADFGPSGAVYRLPFQAVHPDFQFDLDPHGLVHARLSVPGDGVFEASQALVRIRAYSSVRDHVQQATGSRFLPVERVDSRE
jgi:hypothetical protein